MALKIASFAMTNGAVSDIQPAAVPPDSWSDSSNIVFREGMAERARGYAQIGGNVSVCSPLHLVPINVGECANLGVSPSQLHYAGRPYAGAPLKIGRCITSTSTHVDVTPAAWAAGPFIPGEWTGGVINGTPYFNHPGYAPVQGLGAIVAGTPYLTLADWVATFGAGVGCKALRHYREFLFALGQTNVAYTDGDYVAWSARAAAASPPLIWTPAPANAAGNALLVGGGEIVDAKELAEDFIIYKKNSIWRARYIGGNYIFDFSRVLVGVGLLSQNCVVNVGGTHFFMSANDVLMWNGAGRPQSVIDGKVRKKLELMIDANYAHSFLLHLPRQKEIWCCFSTTSATSVYPDYAVVIDLDTLKCGIRDWGNANVTHGCYMHEGSAVVTGLIGDTVVSYDDASAAAAGRFYQVDTADTLPGINLNNTVPSFVYRDCLDFGAPGIVKTVRWVRPWINRLSGSPAITISAGGTATADLTPTYTATGVYQAGTSDKVNLFAVGRYISIVFSADSGTRWICSGFDVGYETAGYE